MSQHASLTTILVVGLSALGVSGRGSSEGNNNNSASPPPASAAGGPGGSGPAGAESQPHSLETLLRNIEGLLAIAAHNARQQQSQLHLQKGEPMIEPMSGPMSGPIIAAFAGWDFAG